MYDVVVNPIIRSSFFPTPLSYEDLNKIILSLPKKDQALAFRISILTSNLCNKLVEDEILSKDIFAS
jgi:hypothetical protein